MNVFATGLTYRGWNIEIGEDKGYHYRMFEPEINYGGWVKKHLADPVAVIIAAKQDIDVTVDGRDRQHNRLSCAIELACHWQVTPIVVEV